MSQCKKLSEVQLELMNSILKPEVLYPDTEEEALYSLLEEILSEIFVDKDEEDSLSSLSGNSIYDLADEKEILSREKFAQDALNEGSSNVEDFESLICAAEEYFENPDSYPLEEESEYASSVTGFLQIYSGHKLDKEGNLSEIWKSTSFKITIEESELLEPEKLIKTIEISGFKWTDLIRIVFYGPFTNLLESRFYTENEAKELVTLDSKYPNILLAIPDYEDTYKTDESIYDWIDREIQEGIIYGITPNVGRIVTGHWEMTRARLDELATEESEYRNLLHFSRKEKNYTNTRNNFIEKYSEARRMIRDLNEGKLNIDAFYNFPNILLDEILLISEKFNERINSPVFYLQIKSLATKSKIQQHTKNNQYSLSIIQKINKGENIDVHLITLSELEKIFAILWGNIGIKIVPERRDMYFHLKSRLLQLRKAHAGRSA